MSKKNKMVFMSKLFLFTSKNELIEKNLKIIDLFVDQGVPVMIVAKQATINVLQTKIPQEYKKKLGFINRSSDTEEKIIELKEKGIIFGVLGIVDNDAIFSFHCKIPLFNSEHLINERVTISDKVKKYGLPIIEFQNVIDCLKAFNVHQDNYFQILFDETFSVISLNNANTYWRPAEEARIKEIFETNLKGTKSSRDQRILLILLFHLINEVTINKYFKDVDFWGTFPSSNPDNTDTSVSFLKEAVRVLVNGGPRTGPEILIRHSSMQSKHNSGTSRLVNKSHVDFETLIINPVLKDRIKGKVICIIDDYVTNGYSAESAKHLLLNAGAKQVIFLSIGKFGTKYYSTDYKLNGNLSGEYSYEFIGEKVIQKMFNEKNTYNMNNDKEILEFSNLV
ncbi:phosphoribosyltransferase [Bacillus cereus]|nr:phosphoribosyltransferase [Bacillus cereus]MEB9555126.1 phosphoribosyltransferase [Bacillus cereus]